MLDSDYSAKFVELTQAVDWQIELPADWRDYFQYRGVMASSQFDQRRHQRMYARTHGLLWFTQPLPNFPRPVEPIGIYLRDLSRQGVGFVTPSQLYPEESVRIALATFWVEVKVLRASRSGPHCYVSGGHLIATHDPSMEAFTEPRRLQVASAS